MQLIKQEENTKDAFSGINTLNNVSLGGVSCFTTNPVEIGHFVIMKVDCIDPSFEIEGKVVWVKPSNDMFEVGIEFIATKEKLFLLRMVEQICHIEHYRTELLNNEGRDISIELAAKEWIEKHAKNFPAI